MSLEPVALWVSKTVSSKLAGVLFTRAAAMLKARLRPQAPTRLYSSTNYFPTLDKEALQFLEDRSARVRAGRVAPHPGNNNSPI